MKQKVHFQSAKAYLVFPKYQNTTVWYFLKENLLKQSCGDFLCQSNFIFRTLPWKCFRKSAGF